MPASTGNIKVANAPCSWGSLEFEGLEGEEIGYRRMLDELAATGYTGTELGDWGYMPADPSVLGAALRQRGLTMVAAFVPVAFKDPDVHAPGAAHALKTARLLAAVQEATGSDRAPHVVLADANGTDPVRTQNAGRITPDMGLSAAEWQLFNRGVEHVARVVTGETGFKTAFHHHCAGYVETPDEIERLLDGTDPDLVGLTFDTGHYACGAGLEESDEVEEGLDRFAGRIRHVHFKDFDPSIIARARRRDWDYFETVRRGVFCELGEGVVDFSAIIAWLNGHGYEGWVVVEQDVLPGMGAPKESARRNRDYLRNIGL